MLDVPDTPLTPANLVWMFNSKPEGDWSHIPTKRLIPAYVPRFLIASGIHFAWHILDIEGEELLKSSIRIGVWLSADNLRLICGRLNVELPVKPHGSGKGGSVKKIDNAMALVKHMFEEETLAEHQRMAAAITWRNPENLRDSEKEVLKYVSELDSENKEAPEFIRVAKLAQQKLKEKEKGELAQEVREQLEIEKREKEEKILLEEERLAKAAASTEEAALGATGKEEAPRPETASSSTSGRKPSETPKTLRGFLTIGMVAHKISVNRDSAGYGYRAYYPGWM